MSSDVLYITYDTHTLTHTHTHTHTHTERERERDINYTSPFDKISSK